jgi:hypothetical protein
MSISPKKNVETSFQTSGKLLRKAVVIAKKTAKISEGCGLNVLATIVFITTSLGILLGVIFSPYWYILLYIMVFAIYFDPLIKSYARGRDNSKGVR